MVTVLKEMNDLIHYISQPWPWYISGPLIALILFLLIFTGNQFGMSSNLRTLCAISGAGKVNDYFRFDWKTQGWNLLVMIGAFIVGYIASHYLSNDSVNISQDVKDTLLRYGIDSADNAYLPTEIFSIESLSGMRNILILLIGGMLVGFGARYAGGCTSGHAISGLSNLQVPSLIATTGFFIGGLIMIHFIYPLIFL